ncbi:hypothetical protein HPB49_015164 [Dermacentor silvarum]|uniref:Uncharacterized protein n=1 Tax=Dermacentor silvarum TaxID=543639 RepID=A0ACB8C9X0_DERSI|nr:hypothetical protein HPB49_015164 [Dermacentor silvarum]
MERFACPSPDRMGRYRCIDDHVLCDGFIDCPQGEDEDRMSCMFYKTVSAAAAPASVTESRSILQLHHAARAAASNNRHTFGRQASIKLQSCSH